MKKILFVSGLVILLVTAYFSRPIYREWKERRALTQAQAFLARNDYRNAALSARKAISLNPADIEACRLMARLTEQLRSPHALDWWQRVVNLAPQSVSNRFDLVRAALFFGDSPRAAQVLNTFAPADQNSATYQTLAAMVSVAQNNLPVADWHFTRAAQLDPQDKSVQFNQAVLHLQAKHPETVAAAEKTLQSLLPDPLFRKDALRHLVLAAIAHKNFAIAAEYATQLQAEPGATFDDRMLRLSIAEAAASGDFSAQLAGLQTAALTNAAEANTLAAWLAAHNRSDEALAWLAQLPAGLQTNNAVRMARADTLLARKDWAALEIFLQGQDWNEAEFVRLAQLARAHAALQQTITAQGDWQAAVRAAADRPQALTLLTRFAAGWNWETERENLLWTIVQRFPGERWALQSLNQLYQAAGNTRGLQKVFATLADFYRNDSVAQNNLAAILLLLNEQTGHAQELALAAYQKHPEIAAFASTYAFALHRQGQTAAGLKVFQKLTPEQLAQPNVAVYYGVLLAADGQTNAAKKYLDLAAAAPLLPEEKTLCQTALSP